MRGRNWNPLLNLIIEVKRAYETKTGKTCTYEVMEEKPNKTCVNRWLEELNDTKFSRMFSGISLQQYKTFIIAHYKDLLAAEDKDGNVIKYTGFFDLYDSLYMECRGVVIDAEREALALVPFRKFMNLNELSCVNTETVTERIKNGKCIEFSNKLDGSMISAGCYKKELIVAGSSSNNPNVSIQVKNSIDYINSHENYLRMIMEHPEETHIFEHIFPRLDPHIVVYKQNGLYLTGIRCLKDGREYSYHEVLERAKEYEVMSTEVFNTSFEKVLNGLDEKKAPEAEGFVLNIDGFKVKIKFNDYVLIHRAITGITSRKSIIKAVAEGNADDLIAKVPEAFREKVIDQIEYVQSLIETIDKKTDTYLPLLKGKEKVDAMIWINNHVPKKYHGIVREKYFGRVPNYILTGAGHYRTLTEIENLAL